MGDNNDMPSAFALETQPIGETGGEVSAIFGDDGSNITKVVLQKRSTTQSTLSFFSQSDTHSRAVWLMYLVIV